MDILDLIEIFIVKANFIAGVHEAESQKDAEKLAGILINHLNNKLNQN